MEKFNVLFSRLNPRERALSLAVVLVVSLLVGKVFIFDEALLAVRAGARVNEVSAEIARSQANLAEVHSRKPASIRQTPLWAYRKENSGLGNFMRKVASEGAAKRDFTVRRISHDKTEKLPEFEKTKFEIEVEGPFHSIGNFLEELESSHFLTRVESVQVFRIEKELRLCRARIVVNNFMWREQ